MAENAPAPKQAVVADVAASTMAKPFLTQQKSEALDFTYGYSAQAANIAELASHLDGQARQQLREAEKAAGDDMANSKANNFPLRQHSFAQTWQTVTQTPRFLSLSSDIETYTGGAHGMVNFDTLLWDRQQAKVMDPLDIFTSKAAYDSAVTKDFCDGIRAAKKAKGIEPNEAADGMFESCPKASEQTLWLGSSDGQKFDRLTIGITAYLVGPYSEGNYRIDVPMSAALVRAVKPEYAAFVRAKG